MIRLEKIDSDAQPGAAGASVTYRSRGVVLLIGDDAQVLPTALQLAEQQPVLAFAPGLKLPGRPPRRLSVVGGRIVAVRGHLGRFRAFGAVPDGGQSDIAPFCPNGDGWFDLVLDLGASPLIPLEVPPPGYFAPRGAAAVEEAVRAMARWVGSFRKPRYFDFEAALCAHGAQALAGCHRCLDACDAGAIRSAGAVVAIDPYLCQGCAGCSLACPTGAIRTVDRGGVRPWKSAGHGGTQERGGLRRDDVLVIHAASLALPEPALPGARRLAVASLASVGEEGWLEALASGARAVVLVQDEGMPGRARSTFDQHVALARSMLEACGDDPRRIATCTAQQLHDTFAALPPAFTPAPPTRRDEGQSPHALPATKRATIVASLSRLGTGSVAPVVALAAGSSFGAIDVNSQACTVCMACTHLCPTQALTVGNQAHPQLVFNEAACVQCGLCVAGCPERAISLVPRIDALAVGAAKGRVVAEDTLVDCLDCGQPFIGRRQLERSAQMLSALPDKDGAMAQMLNRCMACRARAAL